MQFSTFTLVAAAIVGTQAALNLTDVTYGGIAVGVPFEITWGDATPPVELILMGGLDRAALTNVETITSGLSGATGTYTWTPEATLTSGDYAIFIQDAVTTNYGDQFQLLSATASPTGSASSSGSSSTTPSSSGSTSSPGSSTTGSSTTGSHTSSSSKTGSSTSSSSSSTATAKVNSAAGISSPFAMVFLSFAAFAFLN